MFNSLACLRLFSEKCQMAKPKNVLNGKRLDKRDGRISMRSKCDLFSIKTGMVSFNSAGGGKNCLGMLPLDVTTYYWCGSNALFSNTKIICV